MQRSRAGSGLAYQGNARCGRNALTNGQWLAIEGNGIRVKTARYIAHFLLRHIEAVEQSVGRGVAQFAVVLEHLRQGLEHQFKIVITKPGLLGQEGLHKTVGHIDALGVHAEFEIVDCTTCAS